MPLSDYPIDSYALLTADNRGATVLLVRVRRGGPWAGPDWWKIHDHKGFNISKEGRWEFEPPPSSRGEAFFARCRFDSPEEAIALWESLPTDVRVG